MNLSYSALIIGYKQPKLVENVLYQLAKQTLLPDKVIIVDNGGTFNEAMRQAWPMGDSTALISRPDNPGYGAAVNEARAVSAADALLVLTHDANFDVTLAEKLSYALASENVGAVGPILQYRDNPERIFSAGGRLSSAGLASHYRRPKSAEPYEVDWVDGAIVMFKRAALEDIDWIDERYFLYFEDVDTGWRLNRAGWSNVLNPSIVAMQQPGSHPPYLGMRNMALFSLRAGISRSKHLSAVVSRLVKLLFSRFRRGEPAQLCQSLRGLHDGYAGMSGRPSA